MSVIKNNVIRFMNVDKLMINNITVKILCLKVPLIKNDLDND